LNVEHRKANSPGRAKYQSQKVQMAALHTKVDLQFQTLTGLTPPPATAVISSVGSTQSTLSNVLVGVQLNCKVVFEIDDVRPGS
jgi:hypothetical protein